MIGQFHVISPRGDCIITRDFRKTTQTGTSEKFFRRVRSADYDNAPIFEIDGLFYVSMNKSGIYFVMTSESLISPVWATDLLSKLVKVLKDFCGTLSEESLRRNFVLIYELIDEVLDSGYPQTTAAEILKLSVFSDAVDLSSQTSSLLQNPMAMIPQLRNLSSPAPTIPSSANQRPIGMVSSTSASPTGSIVIGGVTLPGNIRIPGLTHETAISSKNEIFVDILERLSAVICVDDSRVLSSSIDGAIQLKSYLSGNPLLRICLNEDLIISGEDRQQSQYSSSAILDDVLYHEAADLSEFESGRILSLIPPDGEFVLMNYRISNVPKLPFRIYPTVDIVSNDRVDVQIAVRADLPEQNYGSNMLLSLPLPKGCVRTVASEVMGLASTSWSSEYVVQDDCVVWQIKKLQGGSEVVCRARIHLSSPVVSKKVFSPIALHFEVPMYSMSNLQVKYLRINDGGRFGGSPTSTNGPQRWVRYVAQSQSYLYRF
jgi:AP-4 complex subunit mu-1